MTSKNYKIDNLVWAKMKGYPYWPARIAAPPESTKKSGHHYVYFFGTHDHAWMKDETIVPHSEEMLRDARQCLKTMRKKAHFMKGLDEINDFAKNVKGNAESSKTKLTITDKVAESPKKKSTMTDKAKDSLKRKLPPTDKTASSSKEKLPRTDKAAVSSKAKMSGTGKDASTKKKVASPKLKETHERESVGKRKTKRSVAQTSHGEIAGKSIKLNDTVCSLLNEYDSNLEVKKEEPAPVISADDEPPKILYELPRPNRIECKEYREPDVDFLSETIKKRNIKPNNKKLGFLGLGFVGRNMIRNALHTKHDVTVWNRTKDKCEPFKKIGATIAANPCDVVTKCDIIFCCVSDTNAVMDVVFGLKGVLEGFQSLSQKHNKGYIELSAIEPSTCLQVSHCIKDVGGKYVECSVIGDKSEIEEGNTLAIAAGDGTLFYDADSFFMSVSRHAYLLTDQVGEAMQLISLLGCVMCVSHIALAEAITMVERLELSKEKFLEIIRNFHLSNPHIETKAVDMLHGTNSHSVPISHLKKYLDNTLSLAHSAYQHMGVTSMARTVLNRTSRLSLGSNDDSALIYANKDRLQFSLE